MTKLALKGLPWLLASSLVFSAQGEDPPPAPDYPEALVENGRGQFISHCGFCHGRDAMGGSQGLDLTRSELVAEDSNGKLIAGVVQSGRPEQGMPPFPQLGANDIAAITAYIQTQRYTALVADGGRRSVLPEDLLTGNAEAGAAYFRQHCSSCHSATGDLANVGAQPGLGLMMNMLYPRNAARSSSTLRVVTAAGQRFQGVLAFQDAFTVALRDAQGRYRSFPRASVDVVIEDALEAHVAQLARYSDEDMHDVYAYLVTLRAGGANP